MYADKRDNRFKLTNIRTAVCLRSFSNCGSYLRLTIIFGRLYIVPGMMRSRLVRKAENEKVRCSDYVSASGYKGLPFNYFGAVPDP